MRDNDRINNNNLYKQAVMTNGAMTDMQKLRAVFDVDKAAVKQQFPELYYAILAVLDKEKKPSADGYFGRAM